CGGIGPLGSKSPVGHGWVAASGNLLRTVTGLKLSVSLPAGYVTHPWLPTYWATRLTPLGTVTVTVFFVRSISGLPTLKRSWNGPVNPPIFCSAKSASSPVTKTAEHITFA